MGRINLFYIARRNIKRKWFRSLALILAVTIASGALFASVLMMESVGRGAEISTSMLGADVMVVPVGYEAQARASLLAGEPNKFYMSRSVEEEIRKVPGVAQTSVQVFAETAAFPCCGFQKSFLIGFDPTTDFTVMKWVGESLDRPLGENDAILGYSLAALPGFKTYVHGHELTVWGKLRHSGINYFDRSLFVPIETLYSIAEESRERGEVAPLEIERGQISVVLVKAEEGVSPDVLEVRIEGRVPGIIAIPMPKVLHTVRAQMATLFGSLTILVAVLWIANTLMVGAIFTTIVGERRKELGILRAVGANRRHVFTLILAEAAFLTALGGVLGIATGGALFYAYKGIVTSSFSALKIPYIWPTPLQVAAISLLTLLSALAMGVLGALYPAYTSARMDPYNAIRMGE
ncbi:MAG: ABC transporter permease [Euryarchaeota archaeon]|nr:ABC transporter permease [Euryarchaeota archaeon]